MFKRKIGVNRINRQSSTVKSFQFIQIFLTIVFVLIGNIFVLNNPTSLLFSLVSPQFPNKCDCKCAPRKNEMSLNIIKPLIKKCKTRKNAVLALNSIIFDRMYDEDEHTKEVLLYNQQYLQNFADCGYFKEFTPPYMDELYEKYKPRQKMLEERYSGIYSLSTEVFMFDHGLQFLPCKVKEYLRQRDILDLGAYKGDSMIVLQNYTDKNIYGFEPDQNNCEELKSNIEKWNLNKTKNNYFCMGMGEKEGFLYSSGDQSTHTVTNVKTDHKVEMTTIDKFAKEHIIKLGLIKADTEGFSWKIIQGGINTIKEQRPIFCIHVYHNFDEYFRIPQLVREMGNYLFFYRADNRNVGAMCETAFIAYPAEALYEPYQQAD